LLSFIGLKVNNLVSSIRQLSFEFITISSQGLYFFVEFVLELFKFKLAFFFDFVGLVNSFLL